MTVEQRLLTLYVSSVMVDVPVLVSSCRAVQGKSQQARRGLSLLKLRLPSAYVYGSSELLKQLRGAP